MKPALARCLPSYANTTVPAGRSREVIEELLRRVGVDAFRWTTINETEGIEFRWPRPEGSPIAFRLLIHFESPSQRAQMLRVLYWYLKSKIEAVEAGLVDMEQEFLPHMLMPSGQTVYEATVEAGSFERLAGPSTIALPEGRDR